MPRKQAASGARASTANDDAVASYKHPAKRKHIPPAGLEAQGVLGETPRIRYEYNPHLPPVLRSAPPTAAQKRQRAAAVQDASRGSGAPENAPAFGLRQSSGAFAGDAASTDRLPELLATARQRPLTDVEARILADALRRHEPWLEWSGKREKPWFEVEPVALHMHERVSTQAILRVLAREDVQRDLFADPQLDYAKAVQFYQVDVDWANRMILGDSLQVMASLARREDLAGRVQMIYLDPPYGIKFASNFQPQLGQRDVKDREQDLTREPEMVKAYRDTWTLGIHSYLAYLRDRLAMARELLADTGSIFVQISDENLHRVRCLMDEVFGPQNFIAIIAFKKTSGLGTFGVGSVLDFLLWYGRDKSKTKTRELREEKQADKNVGVFYDHVLFPTGELRRFSASEADQLEGKNGRILQGSVLYSEGATEKGGFEIQVGATKYRPPANAHWKTSEDGMKRMLAANRVFLKGNTPRYVRYLDDFPCYPLTNVWVDTGFGGFVGDQSKTYVVQTASSVIERCLLMTTDPGDLVLDPTCGSGTTAYVAEQWGRRWITCDTSRVALALARQRLMTARFPFYQLRALSAEDVQRNPNGTWLSAPAEERQRTAAFQNASRVPGVSEHPPGFGLRQSSGAFPAGKRTFRCKTVPHITLKSIARNTSLDPIFAKHEPLLAARLKDLNTALKGVTSELRQKLAGKLIEKQKRDGKKSVTEADRRRWELPTGFGVRQSSAAVDSPAMEKRQRTGAVQDADAPNELMGWREWEVPFDTDPDWPKPLRDALTAYRAAWRAKMDDVNACIAANAEMEELVDKPEEVKGVVRVAGPFTMEGVIAVEDGFESGPDGPSPIAGAPDQLETFGSDAAELAAANAEAHLDKILRLLKASGVDFPGNKNMKFSRLDPLTGASLIHAEGEWLNGEQRGRRVAVSVGPEFGHITAMQVEDVIRSANRKGYDDVVFAAFGFDATAQDAIESASHPKLRLHMALIRPDVAMSDLLKTQPGSQLFTVFSAPRVKGPEQQKGGEFVVELEGMDVYDPVSNAVFPSEKTGNNCVAAWFLDSDYDGRTFCICQAFFPDKSKWDKLAKALGDRGVVEQDAFAALSGFKSLPFPRPARLGQGETWRVAVKVIDSRGNEGQRVLAIE